MSRSHELPQDRAALLDASRALLAKALALARAPAHPALSTATFYAELARLALEEVERSMAERDPDAHAGPAAPLPATRAPSCDAVKSLVRASDAGFQGHSSVISVTEILGLLQVHAKSGFLRIATERETILVAFDEGALAYAYSDNSPVGNRLGEILVARGAIDQPALTAFLRKHSTDHGRLGEALERGDLVRVPELREAIEHQVHHMILRAQEHGTFYSFTPGTPGEWGHSVRMSVVQLLLECARIHDESGESADEADDAPADAVRAREAR